jgi:putative nucleotidyltransferase with HDIG domain
MLALLGCTYFVTTSGLVAAVISATEGKSFFVVWRTSYLWAFPYYLLGAATAGLFSIAQKHLGWQTSMLVVPVVYLVYRSYRMHLGRLEEQKKHAEETAALHLRTIESLALAIEAKDHTTHDHLQRVQVYAVEIAKELKLSETELQAVRAASLLHDIGKIAVPEHIICKPGKLTPEEFEKMKIHPVVGAEILARAQFPYPVAPIVHSHHEKWDGSGYPDGLKGSEIPMGARILSAVDFLDALASDRQYRRALPLGKAMEMVVEQSGRAFDPVVVAILQKRYVELEQLARCSQVESLSLSTDIKIQRGAAPDAGFEEPAASNASLKPAAASSVGGWREMSETLQLLSGVLSPKDAFAVFACRLRELVPADGIAIYSRSGGKLTTQFAWGPCADVLRRVELTPGEGVSGWVAANGKSILNGNASADVPGWPELQSVLAIPIGRDADNAGVAAIYSTKADAFTPTELRELISLSTILSRLTEDNELRGLSLAVGAAPASRDTRADLLAVTRSTC